MTTPTKKELEQLAVRALGEGATVEIYRWGTGQPWEAKAEAKMSAHFEMGATQIAAKLALAAALAALVEVRK